MSDNHAARQGKADVLALAEEIREINAANGWNLTVEESWHEPYKIPAVLALIHSEISEYASASNQEDRLEELADIRIRILDLAGAIPDEWWPESFEFKDYKDILLETYPPYGMMTSIDYVASAMHCETSRALEVYRKTDYEWPLSFVAALAMIYMLCGPEWTGFQEDQLLEAVRSKMAKNRLRGYRHGGKRV